mmetsp:Transcript_24762/g.68471  ORF Transcript_24762/g.68471 Transcript_24762/m.68471 type:complete len:496 (-) Transcript_24762:162-1649(-)
MSSKKRRSDTGHLRKEEYDALMERSSGADHGDATSQFLSEEEQQRLGRRRVRVKRPANTLGLTPPSAAVPSSNPFAGVNLLGGAAPSTGGGFSFGAATSAKPAAIATTAAGPAAPVLGGFGSGASTLSTITSQSSSTKRTRTQPPAPAGIPMAPSVTPEQKAVAEFFVEQDKTFQRAWEEGDPGAADQSRVLWKYMVFRRCREAALTKPAQKDSKPSADSKPTTSFGKTTFHSPPAPSPGATASTPAPSSSTTGGFTFGNAGSTPGVALKQTSGFTFGASASNSPAAAAAPSTTTGFSFGGGASKSPAPAATTGFSFGGATASPAPASANGGFSFPTSSPAPAAPATSTTSKSESQEEETPNEDDGVDGVQRVADPDWDDKDAFGPVVFFRQKEKSWKTFADGELRLQVSKTDDKKFRMVMRDKKGLKVLVNMVITKDMKFKARTQVKKGQKLGYLLFQGWNQGDDAMRLFQTKATSEVHEPLLKKLEEFASQAA